jgi:hypothetical protein
LIYLGYLRFRQRYPAEQSANPTPEGGEFVHGVFGPNPTPAPYHIIGRLNVIAINATARWRMPDGAVRRNQHQKIRSKFAQCSPALAVAEQS